MGKGNKTVIAIISVLCLLLHAVPVNACELAVAETSQAPVTERGRESSLPHLIQTVSEQDIYEGLIALGMLECRPLLEPDCKKAYETVKNCVVRVNMGNAYGSGVIWELTPDCIVIATNAHVLDYWEDDFSFIHFQQGYYVSAHVLGVSRQYDVGFLAVDNDSFSYGQLEEIRCVSVDETVYESLAAGDVMFCAGVGFALGDMEFHEGTVGNVWKYIDEFENNMLYCHGFAKEGMSGGGAFDGRGYLIGMLSGGTRQNETASVPLVSIMDAYTEIMDTGQE